MMHEIARLAIETDEPIERLVDMFYAEDGPLAERGWEIRPQQRTMSLDIALGLGGGDPNFSDPDDQAKAWSIHEAPTGTGKGLAYLVAGALRALREEAEYERRVEEAGTREGVPIPSKMVVSTANISLQEQLVRKDIPLLAEMLGVELRGALIKGKNNYLCLDLMDRAEADVYGTHEFKRLQRWGEAEGCTGDKEDLDWEPTPKVWGSVSATQESCSTTSCPYYRGYNGRRCFWRKATVKSFDAHILVTNHHYVARSERMGGFMLAVDEAHEFESALRSSVSDYLTGFTGKYVAGMVGDYIGQFKAKDNVEKVVTDLIASCEYVMGKKDVVRLRAGWIPDPESYSDPISEAVDAMYRTALKNGCRDSNGMLTALKPGEGSEEEVERSVKARRAYAALKGLSGRVYAIAHGKPAPGWPGNPWTFYAERVRAKNGEQRVVAKMAPADVSWAAVSVASRFDSVALTSATLPDFKTLKLTFGMDGTGVVPAPFVERRLPSPYPLNDMGVLVVPGGRGGPSPKTDKWRDWAAQKVVSAVEQAQGRTLVLCTSYRQMMLYTESLRNSGLPYPVKRQGEEGRSKLRDWFTSTTDGVLVASRTFFQGLDVQGESLACVVIDRIPFGRPDDPVEEDVGALLVERAGGGTAYTLRTVPEATNVMAQGAGRLIRHQDDRGAVVVLDNRILGGGTWRKIKDSLPAFRVSFSMGDVGRAIRGELPLVAKVRTASDFAESSFTF